MKSVSSSYETCTTDASDKSILKHLETRGLKKKSNKYNTNN